MKVNTFDDFDMPSFDEVDSEGKRIFDGQRMSASFFEDRIITFRDVEFDVMSKVHRSGRSNIVSVEYNKKLYKFFTNNKDLLKQLQWCMDNHKFPFLGKLRRMNTSGNPDYRIVGTRD